jgi:BolA protein
MFHRSADPSPEAAPLAPEVEAIRQKLTRELEAESVTIVDNSWMHAGHSGNPSNRPSGTHLAMDIVSARFSGVSAIDRHRMVHALLKEEMATHLHALELKTRTP